MSSRRYTRKSPAADGEGGFSLIEILVALLLAGVAMALFVRDFGFTVQTRRDMDLVVETQQALHATHTFVTQELRQAGACLPENGEFISLAAANGGTTDQLTLRIGVADRATLACLTTVLVADHAEGADRLDVQGAGGFEIGQWIYVTRIGGKGGTFRVASVGPDWLQIDDGLDADYVMGGGVYAIEERVYAVQEIGDVPVLTVAIDGAEPQPLVAGVEEFDLRYRMAPCPPCAATDEPVSSAEWRSVREVELRVVARSTAKRPRGDAYVRVEGVTAVHPRNLL